MKKTVSVLLALLTLLSVCCSFGVTAFAAERYESAYFPMDDLQIVRTNVNLDADQEKDADKNGGHVKFAWDLAGADTGLEAPFTGRVLYIDQGNEHAVFFQSCSKVYMPNGRLDYLTLMLVHDDDVSDLQVGQVIRQGEHLYDQGTFANGRTGVYQRHVHIEAAMGKLNISTKNKASKNILLVRNAKKGVQLSDCFYLKANCRRSRDYIVVSSRNNAKISFSWKTVTDLSKVTVNVSAAACSGKNISVSGLVSVKYGKTQLRPGRDFLLSVSAVKNVGKYDVTLIGIGQYAGSVNTTVTVIPGTPSAVSFKGRDLLNATRSSWMGSGKYCGYKVQMGQKRDFSDAKLYCINSERTETSLDATMLVRTLKNGGTYYVRICACSRVSYHGKTVELRSNWSEVKAVTV